MRNNDFLIKAVNSTKILIDNQANIVRETPDGTRQIIGQGSSSVAVPTKVSQLENDVPYATAKDISNLATKEDLASIPGFNKLVVNALPNPDKVQSDTVYFLRNPKGDQGNSFTEYMWVNGDWELLGTAEVNLEGYATTAMLEDYLKTADANTTYAKKGDIPQNATTQGNVFNGAGQLVQLDDTGKLPSNLAEQLKGKDGVDGTNGKDGKDAVLPENITTQGNAINEGDGLVKLENGKIPSNLYEQPDTSGFATKEELGAINTLLDQINGEVL